MCGPDSGRRQFLTTSITIGGMISFPGCSKLNENSSDNKIEIQELWLFNADTQNEHTFNIRLLDGDEKIIADEYEVESMENEVAGSVRIDQRLPDRLGQYTLTCWLSSNPDRRSEVDLFRGVQSDCITVDVSVTTERNYPAIFRNEDC